MYLISKINVLFSNPLTPISSMKKEIMWDRVQMFIILAFASWFISEGNFGVATFMIGVIFLCTLYELLDNQPKK